MSTPITRLYETLFDSSLAVNIVYRPANSTNVAVRALVGERDTEGRLGQVSAAHDVVTLRVKAADLPETSREDGFAYLGMDYVVRDRPALDDHGLVLTVTGYRE